MSSLRPTPVAVRAFARWLVFAWLVTLSAWAAAQNFGFDPPKSADDPAAASVMRDLAQRLVPVYQEADTDLYLANLTAMQLVTGAYAAAADTSQTRRDRRQGKPSDMPVDRAIVDSLYANARAIEANQHLGFGAAYRRAFEETMAQLDNAQAAAVMARLDAPLAAFRQPVQQAFDKWRPQGSIPQADAVALIRSYLAYESRRSYRPFVPQLVAAENGRRYVAETDVLIPVGRGVVLHANLVRPGRAAGPLPALLRFTLDPADDDARRSAVHGYVGVTAYVRGRTPDGRGAVRPFVHDGEDAKAVIEWIARQPWSDGRVAMVGDGYSGYAAWAAARRRPAALKAIATIAPMAPGIDFPLAGQIFHNALVRWSQQHGQKEPAAERSDAAWRALDEAWYRRGSAYWDIDRALIGKRSPLVRTWLTHPSNDRYWRKFMPTAQQFAQIDVPVLGIAGYYGAAAGALHYHREHLRHRPDADDTLLAGPYDAASISSGTAASLRGLALDGAAQVDLQALRYEWLDHRLKGAKKPALLQDRVNYEVMGANRWRHAPALEAPAAERLRLHFGSPGANGANPLSTSAGEGDGSVDLSVDLADRSDAAAAWPNTQPTGKTLAVRNGVRFTSEPLREDTEIAGSLAGVFQVTPSRQDVDLSVSLYELTAAGTYQLLFEPYDFRASYARDRIHRRLLKAGVRQPLPFTTERLTARRIGAGSRLVLVVAVNKFADRQINYGSGKDVNSETLADARKAPLRLRWHAGSYIEIGTRKP